MRPEFKPSVEKGREILGPWRSSPGKPYGRFRLRNNRGEDVLVMVGSDGGWDHVSVSLRTRCPTWDEMCWIKNLFFEPEECVVQYHPPESEYVNRHRFCLHLWRPQVEKLPRPPLAFV